MRQGDVLGFAGQEDLAGQGLRYAQGAALHLVDERHVEAALGHQAEQRVRRDVHAQRRLVRRTRAQAAQPARYRAAGRGADAQEATGRVLCHRARLVDQRAQVVHQRAGPCEQGAAERRRAAAGAFAGEQAAAEVVLDAAQLGAEAGLGHAQVTGRLVQAAGVLDRAQDAQVPHFQLHGRRA